MKFASTPSTSNPAFKLPSVFLPSVTKLPVNHDDWIQVEHPLVPNLNHCKAVEPSRWTVSEITWIAGTEDGSDPSHVLLFDFNRRDLRNRLGSMSMSCQYVSSVDLKGFLGGIGS